MSKVVTINIPAAWVPAMEKLIGFNSINTSRSELVRKAVGRKLKNEIRLAKDNIPQTDPKELERLENERIHKIVKESIENTQNNSKLQNL